MRERAGSTILLAAGFLYGLWPPAPAERFWWLGIWAAFSIGAMLWLRLSIRRDSEAAPPARKAQGDWPGHIAHDFRTPLMRLRLQLDAWAGGGAGDPERIRLMQADVLQLEQLAQGLIDITAGPEAWPPASEGTDAAALAREAAERLTPLFALEQRALACRAGDVAPLRVDALQLRRMLDNLLSNALRYAEGEGDVVLAVAMDGPLWVRIAVSNPAPQPAVSVESLREPFVRGAARPPRGDADGFGLGLAVVERLASNAQGRLHIAYDAAERRFCASVLLPRGAGP